MEYDANSLITVVTVVTNLVLGVIGFFLKNSFNEIKQIKSDNHKLQVLVAREYATRLELKESVSRIETKLDQIFQDNYKAINT